MFHVKDTASKVTEERMVGAWYPFYAKGPYFFFRFDEEVSVGRLNFPKLLADLKVTHLTEFGSYSEGEPMFTTARDLLKYREGF